MDKILYPEGMVIINSDLASRSTADMLRSLGCVIERTNPDGTVNVRRVRPTCSYCGRVGDAGQRCQGCGAVVTVEP